MRQIERREKAEARRRDQDIAAQRDFERLRLEEELAAQAKQLKQNRLIILATWLGVGAAIITALIAFAGQQSSSSEMADALDQFANVAAATQSQARSSSVMANSAAKQVRTSQDQVRAALDQVASSREIADSSRKQAEAAQAAIQLNRESLRIAGRDLLRAEALERERQIPRLEAASIKLAALELGDRPLVDVELVNNGGSPALDVGFYYSFSTDPESDSEDLGQSSPFEYSLDRRATFQLGDGMPQDQLKENGSLRSLIFEATVSFKDYLGRSYERKICARMRAPVRIGGEFRPCQRGGSFTLPACCQDTPSQDKRVEEAPPASLFELPEVPRTEPRR